MDIILPEPFDMEPYQTVDRSSTNYKAGYNAAIREIARLNPCRAQSVPDGRVMVPVEPTPEMVTAMENAEAVVIRDWHDLPHGGKGRTVEIRELAVYRAAVAAAPSAQQKESGDEQTDR